MGQKRKFSSSDSPADAHASSNHLGIGATLSLLRHPDLPARGSDSSKQSHSPPRHLGQETTEAKDGDDITAGWQVAGPRWKTKNAKRQKQSGNYPVITHSHHSKLSRVVKIQDLQALILYLLADGTAPQWVSVSNHTSIQKVVVVMVPGLEKAMFDGDALNQAGSDSHKFPVKASTTELDEKPYSSPDDYFPVKLNKETLAEPLQPLADIFPHLWPVMTPGDDKNSRMHSPITAILSAALPKSKEEKKSKGPYPPREGGSWENKRTRITEFISDAEQLRDNGYALHPVFLETDDERAAELRRRQAAGMPADGWVDSNVQSLEDGQVPEESIEQGSITAGREVLAMDCEMCRTEGGDLDLTRVTIIAWDGSVLLDELVKPEKPIIDYLTQYSGITKEKLELVSTTLSDIQTRLVEILHPKTILIGHSLNADLIALKFTHPFIIDTSILYPHQTGPHLKQSLKYLSQKYLNREIQKGHGATGHDSIEDATTCLDLVKQKCEKGPRWGTVEASTESIFKRLSRFSRPASHSNGTSNLQKGRTSAVIDWGRPGTGTGARDATVTLGCASDSEVVSNLSTALRGPSESHPEIPAGGVDFAWARLRELENARGWRNDQRPAPPHNTNIKSDEGESPATDTPAADLPSIVAQTVAHITQIHATLPRCTALVVYSGSGDPREMSHWQAVQQRFRLEYRTRKWDELSVRWTDDEDVALRRAVRKARQGLAFVVVA
ncbi:MAG: hypothetical protein M1825_006135 [Sarcosagium campestre]|nr:MAG: hypothetical protein M1825_006135 [Sarcosagium campestre]